MTKRGKRSGASAKPKSNVKVTSAAKPSVAAKAKATAGPSAKPARSRSQRPERPAKVPAVAPARREAAPPSLLERAKAVRDVIQQSKLTAADPWSYTAKARGWLGRAEQLLDQISANVETAEMRKAVEALAAEVEADPAFQEAQRRA